MTGEDLLGRLICMTPQQRKYDILTYDSSGNLVPILDHYIHDSDFKVNGNQRAYIILVR